MRRVDFVIAGMQKAGTTALHSYLTQHPKLFLPTQKELHFFDNEKLDWNNPDYSSYDAYYKEADKTALWGEATPIYTFWPNALERAYHYNPHMKLIVLLRDRVDRAYSHWAMEVSRNSETLSFSEAIRSGRKRLNDTVNQNRALRVYSYVERGFYMAQISKTFNLFGREQVLILENESLLLNPTDSLSDIFNFLNVSPPDQMPEPHFLRPVKTSSSLTPMTAEDRDYLQEIYAQDIAASKKLLNAT